MGGATRGVPNVVVGNNVNKIAMRIQKENLNKQNSKSSERGAIQIKYCEHPPTPSRQEKSLKEEKLIKRTSESKQCCQMAGSRRRIRSSDI